MSAPHNTPPPPSPAAERDHARDIAAQLRAELQRMHKEKPGEDELAKLRIALKDAMLERDIVKALTEERLQQACGFALDMGMALEEAEESKRMTQHHVRLVVDRAQRAEGEVERLRAERDGLRCALRKGGGA